MILQNQVEMAKLQKISATIGTEVKYSLFYSKYPFNRESLVSKVIIYEGLITECDKKLLEGIPNLANFKYIRIWHK